MATAMSHKSSKTEVVVSKSIIFEVRVRFSVCNCKYPKSNFGFFFGGENVNVICNLVSIHHHVHVRGGVIISRHWQV